MPPLPPPRVTPVPEASLPPARRRTETALDTGHPAKGGGGAGVCAGGGDWGGAERGDRGRKQFRGARRAGCPIGDPPRSGHGRVADRTANRRLSQLAAAMVHISKAESGDWLTAYLKYLLFIFNLLFWVGGAAVTAVGAWSLVEKSHYLSVLPSSTFAVSAYILIFAGTLVLVTGFLGFCAVVREQRDCLSVYFCLLLGIFLVELVAGVLAHVYYQRLSEELKQHLNRTLVESYGLPRAQDITHSVDRLQQDFRCCGSHSSADWQYSAYIRSPEAAGPWRYRQLLQDPRGALWSAGSPLEHLQGGGRLHLQTRAVPS
uniref:Uncharacterized protein n=2 Tax=Ornithorhynchus anatinus TaxID=9258 RepID=A0A6I8P5R9_ORNAN